MCWCTPNKRTPICTGCPPEKRAHFPESWGGTRPELAVRGEDACPIPPARPLSFVEVGHE